MSKKLCLGAVVLALVVPVAACGDDDGGAMLMDSGPRAETSTPTPPTPPGTPPTPPGTPPTPPGTPPTPPGPPDGGREGGPPTPPPPTPPPPPSGTCGPMVTTCIMGCGMDNMCAIACIEADPTCVMCLNTSIIECALAMGCDDEADAVDSCAMMNMCTNQACIEMNCSTQFDAFIMCIPEACQRSAFDECL